MCPKCGEPNLTSSSYCRPCQNAWQNARKKLKPPQKRTEEYKVIERLRQRERRANEAPEQRRIRLEQEKAWRLSHPVPESKMQERRDKAVKVRSGWSKERWEQQQRSQKAHYKRMQFRPAQGLCAYSVNCNEKPVGKQKFCLVHWLRGIRQADLRLRPEYSESELLTLWNFQKDKCAITGVTLIPGETATLDHIVPVARGGKSTIENIRFVHWVVNRMKWDLTDVEFQVVASELFPRLIDWAKSSVI